MKKSAWVSIFSLFIATHAFGYDCNGHTEFGEPNSPDKLLCRNGYAVGYSYEHKAADWVSYKLTRASVAKNEVAVKHLFASDMEVPEKYRATLSDYKAAGYDRGHLAPPQLMSYSFDAMKETYLLSNIAPQKAGLNRYGYTKYGAWGALETYERSWALKRGQLHVYAGPVYKSPSEVIGSGIQVPSHFYKIFYDPQYTASIAFLIPHVEDTAPQLAAYITSIDCIEEITGMDFLNQIESPLQQDIENAAAYNLNFWSMKDGKTQQGSCVTPPENIGN